MLRKQCTTGKDGESLTDIVVKLIRGQPKKFLPSVLPGKSRWFFNDGEK
jgi:hypothetical protein